MCNIFNKSEQKQNDGGINKIISLIQYYPLSKKYGAACIIDALYDEKYKAFIEYVNAADPRHQSIVMSLFDVDWRKIDVVKTCEKILINSICEK